MIGRGSSSALLVLTTLVLGLGCSAAAPAPQPEPAPPPAPAPRTAAPTGGSPATAPEFDPTQWVPPETGPSPEARRVLATLPDPGRVPLPRDLPVNGPRGVTPAIDDVEEPGCREVQLLATAERARAERASRRASTRFGLPARVVPGGGLYRVRVGGCLGAGQAKVVRDTARRLGYDGAFLVDSME